VTTNNVAPRFGLALGPPQANGKNRYPAWAYGLFYDHPLLAIAFDSVTADGGRSVQLLSRPEERLLPADSSRRIARPFGGPGSDTPANLNGSSIFQGVLNTTSADAGIFSVEPRLSCEPATLQSPLPQTRCFAKQKLSDRRFFRLPIPSFHSARSGKFQVWFTRSKET